MRMSHIFVKTHPFMETQNVSFLISVTWGEDTIEKCINSILEQKFNGKTEIVVVDDACKDNAIIKASQLAKRHKEIKIITNEKNLGLGASLNRAVHESKYENIVIVICDYIFEDKKWTQKMLDAINSGDDVASCETYLMIPQELLAHYNYMNKLSLLSYFRKQGNIGGAPNIMFKKKIFMDIGGYDTKTFKIAGEDQDIRLKLLKKGYKIIGADKTNASLTHFHGAHNPKLKELLLHKALPVGGEASGVLFRRYGFKYLFLETKFWNPVTSTILYLGLLVPYFRYLAAFLLVLMILYYASVVALKLKDIRAILLAPFFKVAKDLFVIFGFWKGFLTGKQTFK